jgi:UDP-N-acetylglucosamine 2-epimerase (non-hydrolysing)
VTKQKILLVVGARPNFIKVAPVLRTLQEKASERFDAKLVHTGQHYDANMSDVFFADLAMPQPDFFLGVGSGTHAEQTAKVMTAMESLLASEKPDLLMVAGDVNSTLAAAIVAAKANVRLAHIESGLRSYDRTMPEEINRIVADEFSEYCFVTERSGIEHLRSEGIGEERIHFVGNTMIDTLVQYREKAAARFPKLSQAYKIHQKKYALVTLHRPSNVDSAETLIKLLDIFDEIASFADRIIFPIHPRTRKNLSQFGFDDRLKENRSLTLIDPVGYLDFLSLQDDAAVVLTDSGGVQEETTSLGVPCLTLRENTERPVTINVGTNIMTGLDARLIISLAREAFTGKWKTANVPELWDGKASVRIVEILRNTL